MKRPSFLGRCFAVLKLWDGLLALDRGLPSLSQLFSGLRARAVGRRRRPRLLLAVEPLEERQLLNGAPVANPAAFSVVHGRTLTADLGPYASDPDSDPLTFSIVQQAAHGIVTMQSTGGLSYSSQVSFVGTDLFTYQVSDGSLTSVPATVSINVSDVAPVANDDGPYTAAQGQSFLVPVLANDTDADGDPLTAAVVQGPSHGVLTTDPSGNFDYTPDPAYSGPDTFTYRDSDGALSSNTATVTITINASSSSGSGSGGPVAVNDYAGAAGNSLTIPVLANDYDTNGDALSVQSVGTPAHGTAVLNANGTVTYTPQAGFQGTDSFPYTITDGHGGTSSATVTITNNPGSGSGSGSGAPVAVNDYAGTSAGTPVTVPVLANDYDNDGYALSVQSVGTPGHGTAVRNADGTVTYTPGARFQGSDNFPYTITDGHGGTSSATVTITVSPGSFSASGVPVSAVEGAAFSGKLVATFTDSAGTGSAANYTATIDWGDGTASTAGAISYDSGSGTYSVTGDHTYAEEGSDTISVTIQGGTASGETVTSTAVVSDPPLALNTTPLALTAAENLPTGSVAVALFTDAGGPELTGGEPTPGEYSASIDWGDGSGADTNATVTWSAASQAFTVFGSHTYAEEGANIVHVAISHGNAIGVPTLTAVVTVADAQITAPVGANLPAMGQENVSIGAITGIATFTDPAGVGAESPASDFTATIDWGDNTSSSGTIFALGSGNYRVDAPAHVYAEEGTYAVTVTVTHDLLAPVTSNAQTIIVADQQLTNLSAGNLPPTIFENTSTGPLIGIATFSDPAGPEADGTAAYAATVHWGDATTATGTVVGLGNGNYRVDAPAHIYGEEGTYSVTVTLTHDTLAAVSAPTQMIVVTDQQITNLASANLPASGNEAAAIGAIIGIATFTDPAGVGTEAAGDFGAAILWGDGATSAGTIVSLGGGSYRVDAPAHTYSEEGTYTVTVTVQHDLLAPVTSAGQVITIADQQLTNLTAANLPPTGLEGAPIGPVTGIASFTDPAGADATGDYTAVINWGDGNTDAGTVIDTGAGTFRVDAPAHSYSEEGTYDVSVAITHDALTAATTPDQTITVADQPLMNVRSGNLPSSGLEGAPIGAGSSIATFDDPAGAEAVDSYTAMVDWGDGTTSPGTVVNSGGTTFAVNAPSHTYLEEGTYTVTISIAHQDLAPVTTSGQAIAIADRPITNLASANLPASGVEGASIGIVTGIASFSDPGGADAAGDYSATVDWGDGTIAVGTVINSGGNTYRVDAPAHTYAEEGSYSVTVAINHDAMPALTADAQQITIADQQLANLTAGNLPAAGLENISIDAISGIATFTDLAGAEALGDYTATVHWGDGSSDSAGLVLLGGGDFRVDAPAHAYAEEGTYTVTVTLTHDALPTVTTPGQTIVIADQPVANVTGPNLPSAIREGAAVGAIIGIATFTDLAGPESLADYTATIDWGDGATVPGTIVQTGENTFRVDAPSHTYAEEGSYTVNLTIHHDTAMDITVTGTATVADQPLSASGVAVSAVEGAALSGNLVATFTDAGGAELSAGQPTAGDYSATIDWGDGTAPTAGAISYDSDTGTFDVRGDHTYAEEGTYTVTVTVTHNLQPSVVVMARAVVANPAVVATLTPVTATEGLTLPDTTTVATFTDPGGAEAPSDYSATIDWGDGGPAGSATLSSAGGTFSVKGGHSYAEEGTYTLIVKIGHDAATSVTLAGTVTVNDPAVIALAPTVPIPVHGTGLADPGSADPYWAITDGPTGAGPAVVVTSPTSFGWQPNPATSQWISADAAGADGATGTFTYETSVDLTGLDPATAQLLLNVSADDDVQRILLNGVDTGIVMPAANASPWTGFTSAIIASGFQAGVNTLDIVVANADGHTGLQVQLSGTAVPEIRATDGIASPVQTLATFTDPGGAEALTDYAATVNWGDGTPPTTGAISYDSSGHTFTVSGSHTYDDEGTYPVLVHINHDLTAAVTVTRLAAVGVPAKDDVYYLNQDSTLKTSAVDAITPISGAYDNGGDSGVGTISADLGEVRQVVGIRTSTSDSQASPFTLLASADGVHYVVAATGFINSGTAVDSRFDLVCARYLRLQLPTSADDPAGSLTDFKALADDSVLVNDDADPDSDALVAALVSRPVHGSVTLNSDGTFTYTPAAGYYGLDTFGYRAWAAGAASDVATVTLYVNALPVANDFSVSVHQGRTLDTSLVPADNLLSHASDPDGDALAVVDNSDPAHGTVLTASDGSLIYTPAAGFIGEDAFTYTVSDGMATATATVHVSVVDQPPVAVDDAYAVVQGQTFDTRAQGLPSLLANDSDPDGDPLQVVDNTDPAHGAVAVGADGHFFYIPDDGFVGSDSFTPTPSATGRPRRRRP
jgi:PKD repeat protein